ncbi:hypothetical protein ACP275_13G088400 [Erythranthe tilingii]
MGLKKTIPQQLFAVAKKRPENHPRKSREPVVNHWAILDEIEAPMWVDLTLECNSTYEDKDDEWFNISHPFHQSSARQLISASSISTGPISPKLPQSVSKSRGKDYKSKKQEPLVSRLALNKQLQFDSSSKSSSISTGKVNENTLSQTATLVFSKSSSSFGGEGSNSNGSIMSEATAGKLTEASTLPFGSTTGGLLYNKIRDCLRKSYVTRQASRVEGQKSSSSSKSSVGSSSNPACQGNMEETPDSINIKKMPQLPPEKVGRANALAGPTSQAQKMRCKSYLGMNKDAIKTMDHNKKQKEGYATRKAIPLAKASNSTRGVNQSKTLSVGKENPSGKMALPVKSITRMKEAERPLQDPKITRRKIRQQTSDRTKLASSRDNGSIESKVKKSNRMVETVYFR